MKQYLKITTSLLLLVQAFHLASLEGSTDSPGRTINKSWLRELMKNVFGGQNTAQEADTTAMESSNEYSGIASGSMAVYTEEEENVASQDGGANGSGDLTVITTVPPIFPNVSAKENGFLNVSATNSNNSSQIDKIKEKEKFDNSTATLQNATNVADNSNRTNLNTSTLVPGGNASQESTTKQDTKDTGLTNTTESNNTMTTKAPEINNASNTTEKSPANSTALNTPEMANETDKSLDSGSGSERGLASDSQNSKRHSAWGAVLGTAVAVVCVALVAYIILKNKCQHGFSHRKLVEDYPSNPVHRLDNGEPLDLNLGGSAYYNPGLQGDNIQMANFPGRR